MLNLDNFWIFHLYKTKYFKDLQKVRKASLIVKVKTLN